MSARSHCSEELNMMSRPTLLIRADASVAIGTGHVVRCLALAQSWQDRGGDAIVAMAESTPGIDEYLRSEHVEVAHLQAISGSAQDATQLAEIAKERAADWVVVDGYRFDSDYQRALKGRRLKVLSVDDTGDAGRYFADIILNQNPYAGEAMYRDRELYTRLLLGPRFAMLRREFARWQEWKREQSPVGNKVLVTMGGSDPENVTAKIVRALHLMKVPFAAKVIVGSSNPHGKALENAISMSPARIELIHNPSNMAELMAWADIALAAGGSTCWEICSMGLPAILVSCAPNQGSVARELNRRGCAIYLGGMDEVPEAQIAAELESLLLSPETRSSLSRQARQLVDGWGAGRVISKILEPRLRLRRVEKGDCRLLWEWANDPEVRAASFSSAPIVWERHEAWFAEKLRRRDAILYIAVDMEDTPVGLLRYDVVDDSAILSINLVRQFRGRGYGRVVLSLGLEELFRSAPVRKITAYVKPENLASLQLFANAGFTREEDQVINGHPAICLVLERDRVSEGSVATKVGSQIFKIAISQPTYLPWIGYFDLIDQVDAFVLLEDVQFEKQSWQQRNRIKTPVGLQWLTVPVMFRGRLGQLIKDVEIRDVEFWRNHCKAIELNYRRAPFFDVYFDSLTSHLTGTGSTRLVDLNVRLIEWIVQMLGIKTPLVLSSNLKRSGKKVELLASICRSLGASQYVSPLGSAVYLLERQDTLLDQGIDVVFHNYNHPTYAQLFPPFLPYASILDLIFNEGDRSLEIIRSGRREPLQSSEVAAYGLSHVSAQ
jgi:UDP-2,4-diacetamido-2,4,6-trideoxy-beta-L-altropyranose hydrolase